MKKFDVERSRMKLYLFTGRIPKRKQTSQHCTYKYGRKTSSRVSLIRELKSTTDIIKRGYDLANNELSLIKCPSHSHVASFDFGGISGRRLLDTLRASAKIPSL